MSAEFFYDCMYSICCGMSDKALYSLATLDAFDAFTDFLYFVECGDSC